MMTTRPQANHIEDPHNEVRIKLRALRAAAAAKAQTAAHTAPAHAGATATQTTPAPRIQSEQEVRWAAAEVARAHFTTSRKPLRIMTHAQWLAAGEARAKADGCTVIVGMKREGYLHPYLNESNPRPLGTPGVTTSLKLTRQQLADKSSAWAKAKNISIVDAIKAMGVS